MKVGVGWGNWGICPNCPTHSLRLTPHQIPHEARNLKPDNDLQNDDNMAHPSH